MVAPDPLVLAVRENAAWCDIVCRMHRFAPSADSLLWWSDRRTPTLQPDAITLDPRAGVVDVLARINDGPGASVKDSYAGLDLAEQGYTVYFDATWITRPPEVATELSPDHFTVVREKLPFVAWRRAWGGPEDALPVGLRRAPGVTVLGRSGDAGFVAGGIVHRTVVAGVDVVGLSNVFGDFADVAAAAAARFASAWIVGYERDRDLDAALTSGFTPAGPLRVRIKEDDGA